MQCSAWPHGKDDTHMSEREVFTMYMAHRALEARLGLVKGEKDLSVGLDLL